MLTRHLQDADPLRHEPPFGDLEQERIRRTVLRSAAIRRAGGSVRVGRRLTLAATLAVSLLGAVLVGYFMWTRGPTTVLAAVRLEMRLAEDQPTPGLIVAQAPDSGRLIYLHPEIVASNDDIAQGSVVDDGFGRFAVAVYFLPPGAERMRRATEAHLGRPLAILIDGRIISAPVVRASIGDSAVITGLFTRAEAERIVEGLAARN